MHWLVETCVLSDERVAEFREALASLSLPRTFTLDIDQPAEPRRPRPDVGATAIAYGSKSVIRYAEQMRWRPGAWAGATFDYARVQQALGDLFLNRDAIVSRLDNIEDAAGALNTDVVFLRPADDDKSFAGTTIKIADIPAWRSGLLDSHYLATAEFDAVVARPKEIRREWRVVIAGDAVAAASLYRENGERSLSRGCPDSVSALASEATIRYRPAPVFIADIAEVGAGQLVVIEYNAFNSADLYACDIASVVRHVTETAQGQDT